MNFSELIQKKEIVFHTAGLGDQDLDVLTKVVQKSTVLETLNLSCNRLTLADGKFTFALALNGTLKTLYLNQNKIGPEGAKQLSMALKANNSLRSLSLDGNDIGDRGAKSVAAFLAANRALRCLTVCANDIAEAGAQDLAASLKENKGLGKISLRGNRITPKGAQHFLDALEANVALHELYLDGSISCRPAQAKVDAILEDPDRRITQLEMVIAEKDQVIAGHDAKIAKKDDEIQRLTTALARKEEELTSLFTQISTLKEKDEEIAEKDDSNMVMGLTLAATYKAKMLIAPSKADVGPVLCSPIVASCKSALESRGAFSIALSGGSLPAFLQALPSAFEKAGVEPQWDKWHVLLADERCVVVTNMDSNLGAIQKNFTSKVPIPESQVYGIDESLLSKTTDAVAVNYEEKVVGPLLEKCGGKLDCSVLGFGPDGHTCSLFPGHALLEEKSCLVAPIEESPKPPPCRITLTFSVLNEKSRQVIFCGAGAGKAPILKAVFGKATELTDDGIGKAVEGAKAVVIAMSDPAPYPCGMVRTEKGGGSLVWVADADATREGIVIS